jgi:hypothetical protein
MRTALLLLLASLGVMRAETAAGVHWTAPSSWKAQAARPMRAATYVVPAAPGDKEDGECGIYYFGQGKGGSVDDNMKRWVGQFELAQQDAQPRKRIVNGLNVTSIDLSGTYTGAGGPMATTKAIKPGYRLLGAIVEAPEGLIFIKFTAPAKTASANQAIFENLLKSLARDK